MFLLPRCLFWIVLVFICLPPSGNGGGPGQVFYDLARSSVGAAVGNQTLVLGPRVAQEVTERGAEWCKSHGEACADAVLAAMIAKYPDGKGTNGGTAGSGPTLIERALRAASVGKGRG